MQYACVFVEPGHPGSLDYEVSDDRDRLFQEAISRGTAYVIAEHAPGALWIAHLVRDAPEPVQLDGCTCSPVRGAHKPPCPWSNRPGSEQS